MKKVSMVWMGMVLLVCGLLAVGIGCGSVDKIVEVPDLASKFGLPLDQIGTLPIPSRTVSQNEINQVFSEGYMATLYDRYQDIDKGQTPCHSDNWYTACAQKDKIVVTSKKTNQVVKTVELGEVDYIGDRTLGDGFIMAIKAKNDLHVLYFKYAMPKPGEVPSRKVVKSTFSLEKLELGDQKVSLVIRNQAKPGYCIWLTTVEKQELATPLYELDFIGLQDRAAFVKKLEAASPAE